MASSATDRFDLGLVGLGVVGLNLALNLAGRGYRIAAWDRNPARLAAIPETAVPSVVATESAAALAAALSPPRAILLLVNAGEPVDAALADLAGTLSSGDVVIDGGNSNFRDSMRRAATLAGRGIGFVDAGISGGAEGARHGPSIVMGGAAVPDAVSAMFRDIAARADGQPCCAVLGGSGAGHFVKTVHNGIEYALMQAIADIYGLLRRGGARPDSDIAEIFAGWRGGDSDSYLTRITVEILKTVDPDSGAPVLDLVLDSAGQKGTGRWAGIEALELGVAAPTIAAAVFARSLSARGAARAAFAGLYADGAAAEDDRPDIAPDDLQAALAASMACAYAQGFDLIEAARQAFGWRIDRADIAQAWRGGCIIRGTLLEKIYRGFASAPDDVPVPGQGEIVRLLSGNAAGWRRTVAAAARAGVPVPALSSALSWFDSIRQARSAANLIEAQRDYFGAHGFRRRDRDGRFHLDWPALPPDD